jgi:putative transposase
MQRLQAFKYELKPSGEQQRNLCRYAGSCRFVYNKALALQQANHAAGEKFINYVAMAAWLPVWKREQDFAWLKDAPSQALQHALKDLEKAYKNFFAKRTDCPRFKRKNSSDSFRYPDPKQIKLDQRNNRVFLPKLGWICYRNSREVLGELQTQQAKLANAHRNFLHKATTRISQNHALVFVEDLQVRNMSKSAAGIGDLCA